MMLKSGLILYHLEDCSAPELKMEEMNQNIIEMRHGSVDNYQHCEDCKGYHLQHGVESNQPTNQGQCHSRLYEIRIICEGFSFQRV